MSAWLLSSLVVVKQPPQLLPLLPALARRGGKASERQALKNMVFRCVLCGRGRKVVE